MKTSMRISHYEVLGAHEGASPAELKAAYRAKVKELHPDSGGTEEAFEALQIAWSVVGNPEKRREYDLWLDDTRPVMGGARLAVQQRFEERELEVERRAWEARREEARKNAARVAAARQAAAEAEQAAETEHVNVHRHLTMGAAGLVVLVSVLELWRGPSGAATQVEVLGVSIPLPPTTTGILVAQLALGALVALGSVLARPPLHSEEVHGPAVVTSSSQFRIAVGVMAAVLTIWVVVPFVLRAI
jgi:hypothetical protein